jgi:predicted membrane protein
LSRNKENLLSKFYQKIIHPTFFKIISPTVFFKNGFIARDLAVLNIHVDYLTVNITDFLRLLIVYDKVTQKSLNRLRKLDRESILDKVSSAIDLIETNKNLKSYILASDLQSSWYAELHYLYSFYDSKYKNIVKEIEQSNLYNLRTTSFADMIIKNKL